MRDLYQFRVELEAPTPQIKLTECYFMSFAGTLPVFLLGLVGNFESPLYVYMVPNIWMEGYVINMNRMSG